MQMLRNMNLKLTRRLFLPSMKATIVFHQKTPNVSNTYFSKNVQHQFPSMRGIYMNIFISLCVVLLVLILVFGYVLAVFFLTGVWVLFSLFGVVRWGHGILEVWDLGLLGFHDSRAASGILAPWTLVI